MVDVWRNFISRPKLTTYLANTSEVGYSHYGPTFSTAGVLTATTLVALIHNICVEVVAPDGKNHFLDWFAFRPSSYLMGNFSGMDLTMASKFTVAPNHPHEQNTLFIDTNHFSEMKGILTAIKDTWEEANLVASKKGLNNSAALFAEFKDLKVVTNAMERLQAMNYWKPGEYQLKLRVTTENPKQYFDTKRTFSLKDSDIKLLAENVQVIVANVCQQQPPAIYACATPILNIKN